ncbi:DUF1707 domain-containing protein [soil metagenome]
MDRPVPSLSLKDRREQTIQVLCQHFARDNLDIAELEARLDRAHRANALAELDELVQDLPGPAQSATSPARDAAGRVERSLRNAVKNSSTMLALMGGVDRRGHWTPARKNTVIAIMGGAALDFREVLLPPGETEVLLFCLMGGVEIIVPPELAVDASGIAIMGGFESVSPPPGAEPYASVLRVTGVCLMGGVEIQVRRVGETAKDARTRGRAERLQLRERRRLRGEE